ncbi:MAG: hypothetical protein ACOWWH_13035 [Eubacteriaceae bacterium]
MNLQVSEVKRNKDFTSIVQLFKAVIRDINKNTKKRLIKTAIISSGVFLVNLIFLSAFEGTTNRYISSILLKPGNMLSGTMFWSLIGANIANITERNKELELKNLRPIINSVLSFKRNPNKKKYFLGVIISLIIAMILGNPMLSAITAVTFFMSSVHAYSSKLFFIFRLLGKKKGELPDLKNVISTVNGVIFGFAIYSFVGGTSFGIGISVALVVIFGVLFIRANKSGSKGH